MISHMLNRCSKCCTSRKSSTGTLLIDGLYDVGKMVEQKTGEKSLI